MVARGSQSRNGNEHRMQDLEQEVEEGSLEEVAQEAVAAEPVAGEPARAPGVGSKSPENRPADSVKKEAKNYKKEETVRL